MTESEQLPPGISPTPHFCVWAVTHHREGAATVRLRCTWVSARGLVLYDYDHDKEIALPSIGELAGCTPGDVFRLVRSAE